MRTGSGSGGGGGFLSEPGGGVAFEMLLPSSEPSYRPPPPAPAGSYATPAAPPAAPPPSGRRATTVLSVPRAALLRADFLEAGGVQRKSKLRAAADERAADLEHDERVLVRLGDGAGAAAGVVVGRRHVAEVEAPALAVGRGARQHALQRRAERRVELLQVAQRAAVAGGSVRRAVREVLEEARPEARRGKYLRDLQIFPRGQTVWPYKRDR